MNVTKSESNSLSLGYDEMPGGTAGDYMDSTKRLLLDVVDASTPENAAPFDKYQKRASMVTNLKCLMTDRCVTNTAYASQFTDYRSNLLPQADEAFLEAGDDDKASQKKVHHLKCGVHIIANMGISAKSAAKSFEKGFW